MPIFFHTEAPLSFRFQQKRLHKQWLADLLQRNGKSLGDINVIFCTDEYLLKLNRDHLQHDFYTDIITFDYCEKNLISGDLFISLERVKENAKDVDLSWKTELRRVIAHGVLHLLGYKDKSPKAKKAMRAQEEAALSAWDSIS